MFELPPPSITMHVSASEFFDQNNRLSFLQGSFPQGVYIEKKHVKKLKPRAIGGQMLGI